MGAQKQENALGDEAPLHWQLEYRNGLHEWREADPGTFAIFVCRQCGVDDSTHGGCPSKREVRMVGPWEPVEEEQ